MHLLWQFLFILAGIYASTLEKNKPDDYSLNYDVNDDSEYPDEHEEIEKAIHRIPKFVSPITDAIVNEGETIKIACVVDKIESFVLIWKKGDQLIALNDKLISTNDPRVKLDTVENGNMLVISLAEPQDAGDYTCQISDSSKPSEQKHSIKIRVAPEIRTYPESGVLVVKENEPASIGCEVIKGDPTPVVTWKRKQNGRTLPGGETELKALMLSFPQSQRQYSGYYVCSADNGFGIPVTGTIKLEVEHAPSIEQGQTFIHTSENDETEVICEVHAQPKSVVTWYKNGIQLSDDKVYITHQGNKHILILPGIKSSSTFGNYTCNATNKHGSDQKTTEVSGRPKPVNIKSSPDGDHKTEYSLEWNAESITPITEYKLQYRKTPDNNRNEVEDEAWNEVLVTPTNNGDHFYAGIYILKDLEAATHYEARISSKNGYGYGSTSAVFRFGTKGAAPVLQPSTGSGTQLGPHAVVLLVAAYIAGLLKAWPKHF